MGTCDDFLMGLLKNNITNRLRSAANYFRENFPGASDEEIVVES